MSKELQFSITNKTGRSQPEILIHGFIGSDEGEVSFKPFEDALMGLKAKGHKSATVKINTGGGDMFIGFSIYDIIQECGIEITTHVIGMAASMGFVISQAASKGKRKASRNAMFMSHKAQGRSMGESASLRAYADTMDKLEGRAIAMLVESTGKTEEEAKAYFQPGVQRWITAQEALEEGIIDEIVEPTNTIKVDAKKIVNETDAWRIYNAISTPPIKMLKPENLASLGLGNDATEAEINAAVAKVCADKLNLENSVAQKAKDDAIAMVNAAHAEGRIADKDKEKAIELAKQNPAMVSTMLSFLPASTPQAPPSMSALIEMGKNGGADDRSAWTYKEWQKKDMAGLLEMKAKDLPRYNQLFANTGVTVRED
jgi:ATP-dependent Clp endopeptidase proteolytic subunit ClpP